jgi:hypothetical protein
MTRCVSAFLGLIFVLLVSNFSWAQQKNAEKKYPLKVSANGRHLTDQSGAPFLVVADAAWQMLRKLNYTDAVQYLDIRKSQSFNTILVHLLPAQTNQRNVHKVAPFSGNDLSKPDKSYFDQLEKVIVAARERDLVVGIIVSRKSWNSLFEAQGEEICRNYAAFVSQKFAKYENIIWVIGQEENQHKFIYKAVLEGVKTNSQDRLIASFSSCSPTTLSDSLNAVQPDLRFIVPDSTVSVSEYEALSAWQKRIGQTYHKPFVVANLELPWEIADQSAIIRNQAYQSVLSASAGFCHSSTIKNFHSTWKVNITRDGAEYINHFAKILGRLPWEFMQPNNQLNILPDSLDRVEITSFFLSNRRMAMLYIPSSRPIKLDLTPLNGEEFRVVWYSPRTGKRWTGADVPMTSMALISPPDAQAGWDWILLVGSKN